MTLCSFSKIHVTGRKKTPRQCRGPSSENQHLRPVELVIAIISEFVEKVLYFPFSPSKNHILSFRHKNRPKRFHSSGRFFFPLFLPIIGMFAMLAQIVFI